MLARGYLFISKYISYYSFHITEYIVIVSIAFVSGRSLLVCVMCCAYVLFACARFYVFDVRCRDSMMF